MFLLLFFSCTSKKEEKSVFEQSVPRNEKECLKRINEAKKDISEGKIYFCDNSGITSTGYRSNKERIELLKKYNIIHSFVGSPIVFRDLDDDINCYCKFMREKIDEKYGSHFIDSIVGAADEQWVNNHINEMFIYFMCDIRPNYPGDTDDYPDEYSEVLNQDIKSKLVYPKEFIKSTNLDNRSFVEISFEVYKNGDAKITGYWFYFKPEQNEQYEKYFEQQIGKYIKKTGWTPAKIRNHNVNSTMNMRFYFD